MKILTHLKSRFGGNLRGDIYGGITAAIVALPLALALGVLSGAGAAAGLYSAIIGGLIASLFGGCPAQISGPTAGMTVVLIPLYKQYGLEGLFMAMFLAGLLQIGLSFFKLGRLIYLVPHPVITGFTNGIAVIIFTQQLVHLQLPSGGVNWLAVAIAIVGVAFILFWPRITKTVPGSLIVLLVTTVLANLFLSGQLATIGEIPSGLPTLKIGFLSSQLPHLIQLLQPAVIIALLGAIESLAASVVVDEMAGTRLKPDREIFGQGLANTIATLFGGIAGTGALVRSSANVRAGGRTPLSGVISAMVILLTSLALSDYASQIPMATLAAILMATGIGMVDKQSIRDLTKAPWTDSVVMLTTLGLTVTVDLITGIAGGTLLSMVLFAARMTRLPVQKAKEGETTVITLQGPLFFGTAKRLLDELEAVGSGVHLVLDLHGVASIDASGALMLKKASCTAAERGNHLVYRGIQQPVRLVLQRLGVLEAPGSPDDFTALTEQMG